jgi:hypothetical protein
LTAHRSGRELAALIDRTAAQLQAAGISHDDRVVQSRRTVLKPQPAFSKSPPRVSARRSIGYRDAELVFYFEDLKPKLIIHTGQPPPARRD